MSREDQADFNRQTSGAGRALAAKRPWLIVVAGIVVAAAGVAAAPFVDDGGGIWLAATGVLTGAIIASMSIWSFRHPEEAARTIELRNRYTARDLRKPRKSLALVPVLAGALGALRLAARHWMPWWTVVLIGVGLALVVAAALGIQIWRARSGRMSPGVTASTSG